MAEPTLRGDVALRLPRVLAVLVIAAGLPSLPANAEDLGHRRHEVERRIDRAGHAFDQSSEELAYAIQELEDARAQLLKAREQLATARAALDDARARFRLVVAALHAAEQAAAEATASVRRAELNIDEQVEELRLLVVQHAQGAATSLLTLSAVLSSQSPAELTWQSAATQAAYDSEVTALQQLDAATSIYEAEAQRLADAEEELAQQRLTARSLVQERESLVAAARDAKADVASLTESLRTKRLAAAQAKADDRAQLVELQRERQRVLELLRQRAALNARRSSSSQFSTGDYTSLLWPVTGYVSSPFGMRLHPVYRRWSLHDGTDIAAACGTPVRAAADGRILATYYNSAYGNRIIMDNGTARDVAVGTTYNHLSGFAASAGQEVDSGDVIGYVGTTGASTGCHLHFMVLQNGAAVDPAVWLP